MKDQWTVGDMFCGAGGTTSGIMNSTRARVLWAINHDPVAIEAHNANHPMIKHYIEDIVDMDVTKLAKVDILWASLECTHFSNAKGGQSRDADSRMLAEEMFRYGLHCEAKYIMIENVREFLTWGPVIKKRDENGEVMFKKNSKGFVLDDKGKKVPILVPDPTRKGIYYKRWVKNMRTLGYVNHRWKLLNSADYGAYTSRTRYFGIFSKKGYPIRFPSCTHHKTGANELHKWKPVRDVLDLQDEGKSIFGRKKPLSPNTLRRIAYGINKYVINQNDKEFIAKYYGGDPNKNSSINEPLHTIRTHDCHSKVQVDKDQQFLYRYYGKGTGTSSVDEPVNTITTKCRHAKVSVKKQFLTQHHLGPVNAKDIDSPMGAILTKDMKQIITVKDRQFNLKYYNNGEPAKDLDQPLGVIMPVNKDAMVTVEPNGQFISRSFTRKTPTVNSVEDPLNTISTFQNQNALISVNKEEDKFLASAYGVKKGDKPRVKDLDSPINTITTANRHSLVSVDKEYFISNGNYGDEKKVKSVEVPIDTLTTQDRMQLIQVEKKQFLTKYFGQSNANSIDKPIGALTQAQNNALTTIDILDELIVDIKMRFLKTDELKKAQGFPDDYYLGGTKKTQTKHIGNSVPPIMCEVLVDENIIVCEEMQEGRRSA